MEEDGMTDLKTISENLRTQDNRSTADPIFMVQGLRRVYGFDPEYSENIAWCDCEHEADADDARELEDEYEATGKERDGWTRTMYKDIWENVQPFFSEAGAQNYLDINGHNLAHFRETRIYVESAWRNEEWQLVRALLMKGESEEDGMKTKRDKLEEAAIAWWENHRPIDWGLSEHLQNPRINCCNDTEIALAFAVADRIRRGRRPQ